MSSATNSGKDDNGSQQAGAGDPNPPTVAAFSPVTLSNASSANKQRSTILIHQKSPLLIATPPQITRALAYSHPFLLPLNKLAGLLTWTSGDPWESFLLLAAFWATVLYGSAVMRWGGPLVVVFALMLGMYSRRYSPLSSAGWTGEKLPKGHKREASEATNLRHQKTLDEIVQTLKEFTSRCNVLLDPLLELTDFLSTQRTATSATTRPALTTLFVRIILVTPLWVLLTFPPLCIISMKRISLVTGTIFLTWHSRPARVSRTILWRSNLVRRICMAMTGLKFEKPVSQSSPSPSRKESFKGASLAATTAPRGRSHTSGVRFTFILYENQRRWLGLGWTSSLFTYERTAWTDEHLNPAPSKDDFELPDVEGGNARWRWVEGSQWRIEEGNSDGKGATDAGQGWIYYDNKWNNGRRGQDSWGRFTRRRKWYRDGELVELTPSTEITPSSTPAPPEVDTTHSPGSKSSAIRDTESHNSPTKHRDEDSSSAKSSLFRPSAMKRSSASGRESLGSERTGSDRIEIEEAEELLGHQPLRPRDTGWGISDDARMSLE